MRMGELAAAARNQGRRRAPAGRGDSGRGPGARRCPLLTSAHLGPATVGVRDPRGAFKPKLPNSLSAGRT